MPRPAPTHAAQFLLSLVLQRRSLTRAGEPPPASGKAGLSDDLSRYAFPNRWLRGTVAPGLAQIRDSVQQAGDFAERPHGVLRINAGYVAYAVLIQPRLASFGAQYPVITLDITLDNNLIDIVAGGFDAGIRLGYALQRDVIAVPLGGTQQLTVVGSPRYFKRRGTPRTPHELLEHDCIRHRLNRARFFEWEFRIGGKNVTVDVRGRLVLDEMRAVLGAACEGSGLGLVFRQFATAEIASGAVVPILDQFLPPDQPFHLYYANRAHTPSKLRAFIEFMQTGNRKRSK